MKLADFILENYSALEDYDRIKVETLLSVYKNNIIVIEDGDIRGLAIYLKLTDETLLKVEKRVIDLTVPEVINECFKENGRNIHFFLLIADGYKTILKGIRSVVNQDVKSISWFSKDMKQFFIRRNLCQHPL